MDSPDNGAQNSERGTVDSIIEQYAASSPGPSREMLARWVERYPQYAQALAEFTVNWTAAAPLTPPALNATEQAESAIARHRGLVQAVLDRQAPALVDAAPLLGLVVAAQARGLTRKEMAAALDLSIALVDRLDRRLVRYQTIPAAIVEAISRLLSTGTQQVARYLQGAPLLPTSASYRSEQAPSVPEAQDFAAAVEADRTLSPERKRQLLAMADESKSSEG
jgi:hypothetical protein